MSPNKSKGIPSGSKGYQKELKWTQWEPREFKSVQERKKANKQARNQEREKESKQARKNTKKKDTRHQVECGYTSGNKQRHGGGKAEGNWIYILDFARSHTTMAKDGWRILIWKAMQV